MTQLDHYRFQTRLFILWNRAIYAPPHRRWTFMGYGVSRRHERFMNGKRR